MMGGCGLKKMNDTSPLKSAFSANNIRFLSKDDLQYDPLAASMGVLNRVINFDDNLYASPVCSAFRISPGHVLSAAHCYIEGGTYAFDRTYVASTAEVSQAAFENSSSEVRLVFRGLPDVDFFENRWKKNPLLNAPEFIDREHDIAVWSLGKKSAEPYLSLPREINRDGVQLKLYGYPNGNPLALSTPCVGVTWGSGEVIRHDCDSLSGSSGGLIATLDGKAVGLHIGGPGINSWEFYAYHGQFEDQEIFAARAAKKQNRDSPMFWECRDILDSELRDSCLVGDGLNRAVRLDIIWKLINEKSPILANKMIKDEGSQTLGTSDL